MNKFIMIILFSYVMVVSVGCNSIPTKFNSLVQETMVDEEGASGGGFKWAGSWRCVFAGEILFDYNVRRSTGAKFIINDNGDFDLESKNQRDSYTLLSSNMYTKSSKNQYVYKVERVIYPEDGSISLISYPQQISSKIESLHFTILYFQEMRSSTGADSTYRRIFRTSFKEDLEALKKQKFEIPFAVSEETLDVTLVPFTPPNGTSCAELIGYVSSSAHYISGMLGSPSTRSRLTIEERNMYKDPRPDYQQSWDSIMVERPRKTCLQYLSDCFTSCYSHSKSTP